MGTEDIHSERYTVRFYDSTLQSEARVSHGKLFDRSHIERPAGTPLSS